MKELRAAWELRFGQRLTECREVVGRLRACSGWTGARLEAALERAAPANVEEIELVILLASLARADGDLPRAALLLDRARAWCGELGLPLPFQWSLQAGLNAFQLGDYTRALESFIAAREAASTARERAFALTNALFCLDNLGLPFDGCWRQVRRLWRAGVPGAARWGLTAQWDCFDLRQRFRAGDLARLTRARPVGTQAFYFQSWVSELPYVIGYGRFRDRITRQALSPEHLFGKSYRFRTLQGILDEADLSDFAVKELADRVYLWTWRWLQAPDEMPLVRITRLLEAADLGRSFMRLTSEDFRMIDNAVGWIALFHPRQTERLQAWVTSLRPGRLGAHPLLDFERRLIAHFRGRAGDPAELRRDPIARRRAILLARLLDERGALPAALARIRAQVKPRATLIVDLGAASVESVGGRIHSEPVARALALLHARRTVPAPQLLERCFGIRSYDPLAHNTKIYNLLARLRRAFAPTGPVPRFGMKEGRVFAEGEWGDVQIVDEIGLEALTAAPPPRVRARNEQWLRPRVLIERLGGRVDFRRQDIEKLAGVSRSAAHRLLQQWVRKGWVRVEGKARNQRYCLN